MAKTELEKFMEGVKENEVIEDEPKSPVTAPKKEDDDPENVPESIKNRRHRRLEEKLQKEREANIILNERLKAKEEAIQHVSKEVPIDGRLKRIFGDDEKGIELSKHFTEILSEYKGQAREEAIRELREEQERAKKAEEEKVKQYESDIESGIEDIEDSFNVDLSPSSKERSEFLDFVSKIAPKYEDGSPKELPDLVATYEIYQKTKQAPQNNRRQEIASRSMKQSGQANLQKEQMSEEERWLISNGIIKPRRKN